MLAAVIYIGFVTIGLTIASISPGEEALFDNQQFTIYSQAAAVKSPYELPTQYTSQLQVDNSIASQRNPIPSYYKVEEGNGYQGPYSSGPSTYSGLSYGTPAAPAPAPTAAPAPTYYGASSQVSPVSYESASKQQYVEAPAKFVVLGPLYQKAAASYDQSKFITPVASSVIKYEIKSNVPGKSQDQDYSNAPIQSNYNYEKTISIPTPIQSNYNYEKTISIPESSQSNYNYEKTISIPAPSQSNYNYEKTISIPAPASKYAYTPIPSSNSYKNSAPAIKYTYAPIPPPNYGYEKALPAPEIKYASVPSPPSYGYEKVASAPEIKYAPVPIPPSYGYEKALPTPAPEIKYASPSIPSTYGYEKASPAPEIKYASAQSSYSYGYEKAAPTPAAKYNYAQTTQSYEKPSVIFKQPAVTTFLKTDYQSASPGSAEQSSYKYETRSSDYKYGAQFTLKSSPKHNSNYAASYVPKVSKPYIAKSVAYPAHYSIPAEYQHSAPSYTNEPETKYVYVPTAITQETYIQPKLQYTPLAGHVPSASMEYQSAAALFLPTTTEKDSYEETSKYK